MSAERPADWDRLWRNSPLDSDAPEAEARTPRWRAQERLIRERLGGFRGLRVIEIGAGRGVNGLLYARRGARVTLLDTSPIALEQARELYGAFGIEVECVQADAFALPAEIREAFDVSMSFGLCEHFLGARRLDIVRAHLELVRSGGIAFLGVPNRYAPVYRLWMATLKRTGTWPLGTEAPYSARELAGLVTQAGGAPLRAEFGSFAASVVDHGLNQLRYKLGRRGLRPPQTRLPLVDRFAYELLVPALKP